MAEKMIDTILKIVENVTSPSLSDLKAHAIPTDRNVASVDQKSKRANQKMDHGFTSVHERMDYQFKALFSEMQAMRAPDKTKAVTKCCTNLRLMAPNGCR